MYSVRQLVIVGDLSLFIVGNDSANRYQITNEVGVYFSSKLNKRNQNAMHLFPKDASFGLLKSPLFASFNWETMVALRSTGLGLQVGRTRIIGAFHNRVIAGNDCTIFEGFFECEWVLPSCYLRVKNHNLVSSQRRCFLCVAIICLDSFKAFFGTFTGRMY